jgi:hypothetical protein
VSGEASDETALKTANRAATADAIRDAVRHVSAEEARALADRREEASHVYYQGS